MKGKIIKLKNGGVLIYERSKLNNATAMEIGFSVGAYNEKIKGTAHLLEHTLFKKTKNRTNQQVETDRNRVAFLNASTSMDYILIKLYRTNKLLKESMEFVYDVLMNSVVDDEYLESEKGVVKEELNMCLDGESRDIYVKNYIQALSKARFASDIVGKTPENIDTITFKELQSFKSKYFIGNNFVVSVVSNQRLCKIKKLLNEIFVKNIKHVGDYKTPKMYFEVSKIDKKTSIKIYNNNQEKIAVMMSFKINANELEIFGKNYNYTFLARYLSGSQGELFLKLRNKGLIYRLDVDISSFKEDSLFNIVFETSKEKIKEILDIIKDEIYKIVTTELKRSLTEDYKKNLEFFSDEKMPVKNTVRCHVNITDYLSFGKLFRLTKKQKKKLREGVCPQEIKKVANIIFNKNTEMFVTVLGKVTKKYVPDLEYFKNSFLIGE